MKKIPIKKKHWLLYNFLFFSEHFLGRKNFEKIFGGIEKRLIKKKKKYPPDFFETSDFKIIDLAEGEYTFPVYDERCPVVFRGAAAN